MTFNWFNFVLSIFGAALNLWLLAERHSPIFAIVCVLLMLRAVKFAWKIAAPATPSTPSVEDQPTTTEPRS